MTIKIGVKGHFDIYLTRGDTGVKEKVASFDNLILDQGMDAISTQIGLLGYCHVGTGNSTPVFTQTTLDTKVATKTYTGYSTPTPTSPNYVSNMVVTYAFAQGAVVANISEVGVGFSSTQLFCRALTVDGSGNPTTITVTSIDYLTVVYTLSFYPKIGDTTSTITINGLDRSVTARITQIHQNKLVAGWLVFNNAGFYPSGMGARGNISCAGAALQNQTDSFDDQAVLSDGGTQLAYVNGSFTQKLRGTWGNGSANFSITRFYMTCAIGCVQASVSPAIVKDNTMTLNLTMFITWARV